MKNGPKDKRKSYYTDHDADSRNDARIRTLRREFGWDGYGVYWSLVEIMAQIFPEHVRIAADYEWQTLADEMALPVDRLRSIIDRAVELGAFYWSSPGALYSRQYELRSDRRRAQTAAAREKHETNARERREAATRESTAPAPGDPGYNEYGVNPEGLDPHHYEDQMLDALGGEAGIDGIFELDLVYFGRELDNIAAGCPTMTEAELDELQYRAQHSRAILPGMRKAVAA